MTPKEALFKAGRIKSVGRGRISAENHQWLKDNGYSFNKATAAAKPVKAVKPKAAKADREKQDSDYVLDINYTFPETIYKAIGVNDGKVYGMREVCDFCRVSLCVHKCASPSIYAGKVPVKIVPR